MAVKNISTRMKICGRTAKCTGGHSAVEQSGYICREKMYSEYDGNQYAKRANETGSIYETDIKELQETLRKILAMMGEILDRLSNI